MTATRYPDLTRAQLIAALDEARDHARELSDRIATQHERHQATVRVLDDVLNWVHWPHGGAIDTCSRGDCRRFQHRRQEAGAW